MVGIAVAVEIRDEDTAVGVAETEDVMGPVG